MSDILPLVLVGASGWLAGMLVNYLADVLPGTRRISRPYCLKCESSLATFNYLIWPRQCEACGKRRSSRTWIVEAIFVAAAIWLWVFPGQRFSFIEGMALLIYFGVVTVIDVEHRLILHPVSIVGAVLGIYYGIQLHGLWSTILGGLAGYGAMLVLYLVGILFSAYQARRRGEAQFEDALGFGDVNLSGVLGLLLGWPGVIAGLLLTILLAGVISLLYLLWTVLRKRYDSNLAIPYGPFLVASAIWLLYFTQVVK
jgi:leader peptidase (prepilin peptidase)/N-methyltransferase